MGAGHCVWGDGATGGGREEGMYIGVGIRASPSLLFYISGLYFRCLHLFSEW